MKFRTILAAAGALAGSLIAVPASAALIQFSFADSAGDSGTSAADYGISGQFTLDTDVALGTLRGGNEYLFDPAALISFSATISSAGATVATLGFDGAVTNGIEISQAGNDPGLRPGNTALDLRLFNKSGSNALTGMASNTAFTLGLQTGDFGSAKSANYVSDLLYDSKDDLLSGIKLSPAIARDNFNIVPILFGGTGISITNFTPTRSNISWDLETIRVADVSPMPPVGAVPLPAGAVLLLGGLGTLTALRRKRA